MGGEGGDLVRCSRHKEVLRMLRSVGWWVRVQQNRYLSRGRKRQACCNRMTRMVG